MDADIRIPRRALISVSDKTGLADFAQALVHKGVELVATAGGTLRLLKQHGLAVREVSEVTQFPEMMAGRVKTLHPAIHGGILGRRGIDDAVMAEHGITGIDLVIVNLYPFAATVAKKDCTLAEAIENIDIGGPAMLRAAAKNHKDVTVIVDPADYSSLLATWDSAEGIPATRRFQLAQKTFAHTAAYDGMIANYLGSISVDSTADEKPTRTPFPTTYSTQFSLQERLRYGENPHQQAAFYVEPNPAPGTISASAKLQGKDLSYNNIADTDAALECVKSFQHPCCVIVKHANPCGVATASTLLEAYQRAYAVDPTSAFGGVIACNRELDAHTAAAIIENQFVEVIIAPSVSAAAQETVAQKPNVRLLASGHWQAMLATTDYKRVSGGLLVQDTDNGSVRTDELQVVSDQQPSAKQLSDLMFAWKVAKFVKSNAIVFAKDGMTTGIGSGQTSRLYSAIIAKIKAEDEDIELTGSVMASEAFLPFRDSLDQAVESGIKAIIQPGGSVRDAEVIDAANSAGIAMVFTGMRHFRH